MVFIEPEVVGGEENELKISESESIHESIDNDRPIQPHTYQLALTFLIHLVELGAVKAVPILITTLALIWTIFHTYIIFISIASLLIVKRISC